ncbi:hypothetical protein ACFVIM_26720 [Streptomyces sp. NPDC057638]|uniref:hypothetical protein n=1 Tax=Streptomyces sp. NPDC057638 TaxID=3346190 RepID=UPI003693506F
MRHNRRARRASAAVVLALTGTLLAPVTGAVADTVPDPGSEPATSGAASTNPATPPKRTGHQGGGPGAAGATTSVPLGNGERLEVGRADAGTQGGYRVVPGPGSAGQPYALVRGGDTIEVRAAGTAHRAEPVTVPVPAAKRTAAAGRSTAPSGPTRQVRFTYVNGTHDGFTMNVWDRDTWQWFNVRERQTRHDGTVDLPAGRYVVFGMFTSVSGPSHVIGETFTVGDKDQKLTLDAKETAEVTHRVKDTTARTEYSALAVTTPSQYTSEVRSGLGGSVRMNRISLPKMTVRLHQTMVKAGSSVNAPSPYRYNLRHEFTNSVPATPTVSVAASGLARTKVTLRPLGGTDAIATLQTGDGSYAGLALVSQVRVPSATVEYATPWQSVVHSLQPTDGNSVYGPTRHPQLGANPDLVIGQPVIAARPCQASNTHVYNGYLNLHEYCTFDDAVGSRYRPYQSDQRLIHTADGTVVQDETRDQYSSWAVPLRPAGVRHAVSLTRRQYSHPLTLTPEQRTEWTYVPAEGQATVPLTDVVLRADGLDDRNRAGSAPVTVTATASSRVHRVTAVVDGIEYSLDDGRTWHAVGHTGSGAEVTARFTVPAGAVSVSLRAAATGSDGATARQTVTRAFAGPAPSPVADSGPIRITGMKVNGGRVIAPPLAASWKDPQYSITYQISDPKGPLRHGLHLYRGPASRPDAMLPVTTPLGCARNSLNTFDCVASFRFGAQGDLGRNDLAGEWRVAGWARSADRTSFTIREDLARVQILRPTRITISGPTTTVTKGRSFTMKGIAGITDWSTGRWNALPGIPVQLEYRRPNATTWTRAASVKTAKDGTVSAVQKAAFDADWRWLLPRTGEVGAAVSPSFHVDVR